MDQLSSSMLVAAVGVAFVHTALGPDHYLPFVALSRARNWTMRRTLAITAACGVGHVLSSLLLGGIGIAAGFALGKLEATESHRGAIAAWLLFGIGIAYALWGVRQALRHAHHHHHHLFGGHGHTHGRLHPHAQIPHEHGLDLDHIHAPGEGDAARMRRTTTFWALFLVFVLGPCEPLIPLFMLPASEGRWGTALATGAVFGAVTLVTMLSITGLMVAGMARLPLGSLQRWAHTMAGTVIAGSAAAVLFLGA